MGACFPVAPLWAFFSVLSVPLWFVSYSHAAEYTQVKGPATIRVEAERIEEGRVELRLSDRLRVTVIVEGRAALEVQPIEKLTASPDWELHLRGKPEKLALASGRMRWQQTIALNPLKAGDVPLPVEPFSYREDAGSAWETVAWQPIPVRVSTEIVDADLRDLRDSTPPEQLPIVPVWHIPVAWAVLPLGLAVVSLGVVYYRRRVRRTTATPPDAWALCELEQLEAARPSSPVEVERYYTLLSQIVRKYLEMRFQLPAEKQTTAEFVVEMQKSSHLSAEQQQALRNLLQHCDLAKFAREIPAQEEMHTAVASARSLVAQTAARQPSEEMHDK